MISLVQNGQEPNISKLTAESPQPNLVSLGLHHTFRLTKKKCKIVNIFLSISFNIFFGSQKNRLIETVLLSTHNICFGWRIRNLFFGMHS